MKKNDLAEGFWPFLMSCLNPFCARLKLFQAYKLMFVWRYRTIFFLEIFELDQKVWAYFVGLVVYQLAKEKKIKKICLRCA